MIEGLWGLKSIDFVVFGVFNIISTSWNLIISWDIAYYIIKTLLTDSESSSSSSSSSLSFWLSFILLTLSILLILLTLTSLSLLIRPSSLSIPSTLFISLWVVEITSVGGWAKDNWAPEPADLSSLPYLT